MFQDSSLKIHMVDCISSSQKIQERLEALQWL
nr:MAG TPA: hypothetical protein [Caudoviricetes sp.]